MWYSKVNRSLAMDLSTSEKMNGYIRRASSTCAPVYESQWLFQLYWAKPLDAFLTFFAAFFSFGVMADFFLLSRLFRCSLLIWWLLFLGDLFQLLSSYLFISIPWVLHISVIMDKAWNLILGKMLSTGHAEPLASCDTRCVRNAYDLPVVSSDIGWKGGNYVQDTPALVV